MRFPTVLSVTSIRYRVFRTLFYPQSIRHFGSSARSSLPLSVPLPPKPLHDGPANPEKEKVITEELSKKEKKAKAHANKADKKKKEYLKTIKKKRELKETLSAEDAEALVERQENRAATISPDDGALIWPPEEVKDLKKALDDEETFKVVEGGKVPASVLLTMASTKGKPNRKGLTGKKELDQWEKKAKRSEKKMMKVLGEATLREDGVVEVHDGVESEENSESLDLGGNGEQMDELVANPETETPSMSEDLGDSSDGAIEDNLQSAIDTSISPPEDVEALIKDTLPSSLESLDGHEEATASATKPPGFITGELKDVANNTSEVASPSSVEGPDQTQSSTNKPPHRKTIEEIKARISAELMARPTIETFDYLSPTPELLLNITLADVLPRACQPLTFQPKTGFQLPNAFNPTDPYEVKDRRGDYVSSGMISSPLLLPQGHHLAYFPPWTLPQTLLADGTDNLHYPGAPYTRRLWVGGSLLFSPMPEYQLYTDGMHAMCAERMKSVDVVENIRGGENVFVEVERKIGGMFTRLKAGNAAEKAQIQQSMKYFRAGINDNIGRLAVIENRRLLFQKTLTQEEAQEKAQKEREVRAEYRRKWEKKTAEEKARRKEERLRAKEAGEVLPSLSPAKREDDDDYVYEFNFTPDPAMLFRFSALTFNAHRIHLDPDYAKQEGHPDMLVHGPLTLILMLSALNSQIYKKKWRNAPSRDYEKMIVSLEYKNLAPLYVGDEIKVCVKPVTGKRGRMSVWIESYGRVAVKGVGLVGMRQIPILERKAVKGVTNVAQDNMVMEITETVREWESLGVIGIMARLRKERERMKKLVQIEAWEAKGKRGVRATGDLDLEFIQERRERAMTRLVPDELMEPALMLREKLRAERGQAGMGILDKRGEDRKTQENEVDYEDKQRFSAHVGPYPDGKDGRLSTGTNTSNTGSETGQREDEQRSSFIRRAGIFSDDESRGQSTQKTSTTWNQRGQRVEKDNNIPPSKIVAEVVKPNERVLRFEPTIPPSSDYRPSKFAQQGDDEVSRSTERDWRDSRKDRDRSSVYPEPVPRKGKSGSWKNEIFRQRGNVKRTAGLMDFEEKAKAEWNSRGRRR